MTADLIKSAKALVDAVERDVNGIVGMPLSGNGGLVSDETIRRAGECRQAIYRAKKTQEPRS